MNENVSSIIRNQTLLEKSINSISDPLMDDSTTGNLLLMEARFTELISNIRALANSNKELEEALVDTPGDLDFIQAIRENKVIIQRKREQTLQLVVDMRRGGAKIDVADDIRGMSVDITPKRGEIFVISSADESNSGNEGLYL